VNENSFGAYEGKVLPDGGSLRSLEISLNPPQAELFLSGFGTKAAMMHEEVLAVSAPDSNNEFGKPETFGSILFYRWDIQTGEWDFDERDDGTRSGEFLGSKQLHFLDANTLEVFSDEYLVTYFIQTLVRQILHTCQ